MHECIHCAPNDDDIIQNYGNCTQERADCAPNQANNLQGEEQRLRESGPYEVSTGGLYWNRETRTGNFRQRIANFAAWIVAERIEDDGVGQRSFFDIEAEIRGRTTRFSIPASNFVAMGWPLEKIGAEATIEPGMGAKDRVRAAVQLLSGRIRRAFTYSHTGWRHLEGHGWCYLHSGGAIGPDGPVHDVDMGMLDVLSRYRLPKSWTPEQVTAGMKASLRLLNLAPDRVTFPLLGAVYRSVFGEIAFSLHISGFTGSGKSELAALAQQHFGPEMTRPNLPGAWSATASQLEGLAFLTKDTVFVIDEFVPRGTPLERAQLHQKADRVLRAVGNAMGRGRAGPDGKPRPTITPRSLVISTGEDVPGGQSLRARVFVIEVTRGDIGAGDLRSLTPHQDAASCGHYAVAMTGFIQWLARNHELLRIFQVEAKEWRSKLIENASHGRIADTTAQLVTTWRFITQFAIECGAISFDEAAAYFRRAVDALTIGAAEQADIQGCEDPIERFRDLLDGAITSGRAHIAGLNGREPVTPTAMGWRKVGMDWQPLGRCIGWEDGNGGLYLEPEASFAAVQEMGTASGEGLGLSSTTLRKRLHERGLLYSIEEHGKRHLAARRTVGGRRRRVLHMVNLLALSNVGGPSGPNGSDPAKKANEPRTFVENERIIPE